MSYCLPLSCSYTIYYCLLYIFMLMSMNTNYWASDGLHNRGLWNQCSYEENLTLIEGNVTSYYSGTCCSPIEYEVYIGATRGFFIIELILHSAVLATLLLLNIKHIHNNRYDTDAIKYYVSLSGIITLFRLLKDKSVLIYFFAYLATTIYGLFLVIPLGVYADNMDEKMSLSWSFHMLLTCFLTKFIINIIIFICVYFTKDDIWLCDKKHISF